MLEKFQGSLPVFIHWVLADFCHGVDSTLFVLSAIVIVDAHIKAPTP